ncbi:MAG: LytTR family DNA-binding domain-containing protein [Oscillospiraceae bacterium]|nr:LytTR family DNA-binding domain-containing protein [Oscillospiraceae bacterium]
MLQIAICDDQPKELAALEALTKVFTASHCPNASITAFSHPDALASACESQPFHIYLLDMVMPMLSGLDLGRSIRRVSTDAQIIYITTEPGYALDAYAVNPLHYLLKPVKREALFAALALAVEKADFANECLLTLKTHDGVRTIATEKVVCCECRRHTAVYTLIGGETVQTATLSGSFADHIAPLLADRRFLSPHVSFAVNMSQVERLVKEGFFLRGGAFVPVSGKQYTAVRNAYLRYRLGEADK